MEYNENLLSNLELNVKFIKSILLKYGLNYHKKNLSWHYHLFAGFKRKFEERNIKIDKILEIGPEKVAGFVAETMLGQLVGNVPPCDTYWKEIRKICSK